MEDVGVVPAPAPGPDSCRICRGALGRPSLVLDGAPASVSRLLDEDYLDGDEPIELAVYECPACGFVQTPADVSPVDYSDYVMTASHSPSMQAHEARQALHLAEWLGISGKRIVEIGAGDGSFVEHLQSLGAEVTGIEPSAGFRRLASERGRALVEAYVSRHSPPPAGPYDGFVTRQVLEHVDDPVGFLAGIRDGLTEQAGGLVEVPNLLKTLREKRFYDFFPDHLNYFDASTLNLALRLAGFVVDEMCESMHGEYLEAYVRRFVPATRLRTLAAASRSLADQVRSLVHREQGAGRRVVAWGAGGKGVAALGAMKIPGVEYVVDSDPLKWGLMLPVSHLRVLSPAAFQADLGGIGLVILTALAYRDEVLALLRGSCGYLGSVAMLGSDLEVLDAQPET